MFAVKKHTKCKHCRDYSYTQGNLWAKQGKPSVSKKSKLMTVKLEQNGIIKFPIIIYNKSLKEIGAVQVTSTIYECRLAHGAQKRTSVKVTSGNITAERISKKDGEHIKIAISCNN